MKGNKLDKLEARLADIENRRGGDADEQRAMHAAWWQAVATMLPDELREKALAKAAAGAPPPLDGNPFAIGEDLFQ